MLQNEIFFGVLFLIEDSSRHFESDSATQRLIGFNHVSYDILGFLLRLVVPENVRNDNECSNPSQTCFSTEFISDLKS